MDIGATNIRVALGNESGLKSVLSERTDRDHGPEGLPKQIINMIDRLDVDPVSIGVGSIGPLDLREGSIANTPNYPFDNIPIVRPLRKEFGVPVDLLNDCAAAVLGERRFGAGEGVDNLVYVTFSTGLGGGAMVDGHLLIGKDGNAPEIGHLTIDPCSQLVCGCGSRGHWEAYSSGRMMPGYARLILENMDAEGSLLLEMAGDHGNITSEIIFSAASRGDGTAIEIVEAVGRVNAIGFSDLVNVFDPELITVGGAIALNYPEFILRPILENIENHIINRVPDIMITPLGGDTVLYIALAKAIVIVER